MCLVIWHPNALGEVFTLKNTKAKDWGKKWCRKSCVSVTLVEE